MKQQSLQFTVPNWLKWVLIGVILLVFSGIGYSIYIYQTIEKNRTETFATSEQQILNETEITKVNAITRYHGESYYHVINGQNVDGEELLAYVNKSNEDEVQIFQTDQYMSLESLEKQWLNTCQSCELLESQYGIRGNIPLLELTYIDENDRLTYTYFRLKDGTIDSRVSFSSYNYK
ncbi:hypothetical protein GCM10011351_06150 [Paraliobacillus quinghaiensis]|uniref:Cell wall elongation regulator TseB-like domain-containing protein n=1 Tax=Paraliobacillus quinghaiensis TaxID=470815 RepID=A0A917THX8_9BACI|nr:DUF5590 domain-containing protein [Paraliobacillus quinghaiensis]GGM23064.1 hypothetical protein GCM10011351_06150 [Paraliobacillus quinghaiensis]